MTREVGVRLLGGAAVVRGGTVLASRSRALRTLLALLAADPGVGVSSDRLVAALWREEDEPRKPAAALQVLMTRLRTWLDPEADRARYVRARDGGYALHLDTDAVDLVRFQGLVDRALASTTETNDALICAETGLALWRGEPFEGCLDVDRLAAMRVYAMERRRRLVVCHLDALLELDRPQDAVEVVLPELRRDGASEPLIERSITALHRVGRSGEAAEVFRAYWSRLRDTYGDEPSESLRAHIGRVLASPYRRRPASGVMVGRDDTRQRVLDALRGPGRLFVVEGEAGIGKTVLLRACIAAAQQVGIRTGEGTSDLGVAPMAAWHEATRRFAGPPLAGPPGPAMHARLARAAASSPVLLALDDVHRADSGSLGVLTALARLGLPPGLVVLLGARSPDTVARPDWDNVVAELCRSDQVERVRLDGLDRDGVDAMVAMGLDQFGAHAHVSLTDVLWRRGGGHPLHTSALLEVMAAEGDAGRAAEVAAMVPARLRPMLDQQIAALPSACREAVEALAVLQPVDLGGLAGVLEQAPLDLAGSLRPAVEAGVVVAQGSGFAVRHELVAEAARGGVSEAVRNHLHAGLLYGLDAHRPIDAFTRLRHVEGAGVLCSLDQVAHARLEAGIAAYDNRALPEALALFDRAAPSLADEHILALLMHRGRCLSALGQLDRADEDLDVAVERASWTAAESYGRPGSGLADQADGADRAAHLAALAAIGDEWLGTAVAGDPRRLARLQHVEKLALPGPTRFELLAALIREEALGGTDRPDLLAEIVDLADTLGDDPWLVARVRALEVRSLLETSVPVVRRLEAARGAFELARATDDMVLQLDATEQLVTASIAVGDIERARELNDLLGREAGRWHRPRHIWGSILIQAAILLAEGYTDDADRLAGEGMERGLELGVPDAAQAYGVHLVARHLLAGTLPELGDLASRAAEASPTIPAWAAGASLVDAASGRHEQATAHLAEFRRRREQNTSRSFDRPALCLASAAAFLLDDRETAALVRRGLPPDQRAVVHVGFGAAVLGPATLWTALAARTLGDEETASRELDAAHGLVTDLGWLPWRSGIGRALGAAVPAAGTSRHLPFG